MVRMSKVRAAVINANRRKEEQIELLKRQIMDTQQQVRDRDRTIYNLRAREHALLSYIVLNGGKDHDT